MSKYGIKPKRLSAPKPAEPEPWDPKWPGQEGGEICSAERYEELHATRKRHLKMPSEGSAAVDEGTSEQDGEELAGQRFDELQRRLQELYAECNKIWWKQWKYKPGNRKSWEAALKHLQILIRAAVTEKPKSDGSPNLSNGQRVSLGNAWAMLLEKQKQFQMPQSLSNQIQCIQDVTQAISEEVCWKIILDELLISESLAESTRRQQWLYLNAQIHKCAVNVETAAIKTTRYAQGVPIYEADEWASMCCEKKCCRAPGIYPHTPHPDIHESRCIDLPKKKRNN